MWSIPSSRRLAEIPKLYETEDKRPEDKLIYVHFFIGGCDWYVAEYDGNDTFWGFCILNGDLFNAEWGYFSFSQLKSVSIRGLEVECELEEYWKIRPACQVEKIRLAHCWGKEVVASG